MKLIFCDCCKRQINDTEKLYSVESCGHYGSPLGLNLLDVCADCHQRIKDCISSLADQNKESE